MTFPAAAEHLPAFRCPFSLKPQPDLSAPMSAFVVGRGVAIVPCRKLSRLLIVIGYLKYEDNQLE